jgi:hypothetical protein
VTLVILESPFAASDAATLARNAAYLRRALRDSLLRGEAPFASHGLYTLDGALDDTIPEERALGIEAGLAWGKEAERTVVYADHGISPGMRYGIERARREGRPVEYRRIHEQPSREDRDKFDHQDHGLPCPLCGEPCDRDSVNVRVGIIRGPWGCQCGWSESPEYDCRHGTMRDEKGNILDQRGGLHPKGGYVDQAMAELDAPDGAEEG